MQGYTIKVIISALIVSSLPTHGNFSFSVPLKDEVRHNPYAYAKKIIEHPILHYFYTVEHTKYHVSVAIENLDAAAIRAKKSNNSDYIKGVEIIDNYVRLHVAKEPQCHQMIDAFIQRLHKRYDIIMQQETFARIQLDEYKTQLMGELHTILHLCPLRGHPQSTHPLSHEDHELVRAMPMLIQISELRAAYNISGHMHRSARN